MSTTLGTNPREPTTPENHDVDGVDETLGGVPGAVVDIPTALSDCTVDGKLDLDMIADEAYKVTLVLVTQKGGLITKVIDSRSDNIEEAWEKMKKSEESKKISYPLILAEDLPEATERLLEKLLHGDRRILIDHGANRNDYSSRSGVEERSKAEFYMNTSEPPAAISVALPYEMHGINRLLFDIGTERKGHEMSKSDFVSLDSVINILSERGHSLRTAWHAMPPCGLFTQQFLYAAYRRISIQFIPTAHEESTICLILMYPQLRYIKVNDITYSLPYDLKHPPTSATCKKSRESPMNSVRADSTPHVSATLVHHLYTQLGVGDRTSHTVQTVISRWMVINTQATFRESIKHSVDYWCALSMMARAEAGPDDGVREVNSETDEILAQFIQAITTSIRQPQKARAELTGRELAEDIGADPLERNRPNPVDSECLEWNRMITCLDSILANAQRLSEKRTRDSHLEMTNTQIKESRTAIEQAGTVKRLTQLAFVFIPISSICSAFGMNVQELAHRPPPIWVALIVMLGVTLTTMICSLATTHNILWGIRRLLQPLSYNTMAFKARMWLYTIVYDDTSLRSTSQLVRLVRLLYNLCLMPLMVVQELARDGAQYKKQRRETRRHGHEADGEP